MHTHQLLLAAAAHSSGSRLTWVQAIVTGLLQGVSELFPVSSLGHTVLVPGWFGWHNLVRSEANSESFYLAFVVGLHVATAIALLIFFWRDWVRIVGGVLTSIRDRRVETSAQRLGWLLIVATVPAGVTGYLLEHRLRTQFAKPLSAAIFLTVNGFILLAGERLRRRAAVRAVADRFNAAATSGGDDATATAGADVDPADGGPRRRLDTLQYREAGIIGLFQVLALLAGISRSGITMVAGLLRGLDHEDAAKFSFLLATPIILGAGVLKIPDLFGPLGAGVHGQILLGSLLAGIGAYVAVRFLVKYFETRTLTPFAIYCLVAGAASIVRFA